MDGTVQICRGFTVAQWKKLYTRLMKPDGSNSDDQDAWCCAIEVFERRVCERFLSCIEALESADSRSDVSVRDDAPPDCSNLPQRNDAVVPGFAIMALCCLLAETLQSFRCKTDMPPNPQVPSPNTGSKVTWGAGQIFQLPTATKTSLLGQEKWALGPTFVALAQPHLF
jgi:hypothetical protein